jgi:putative ATP-dependent endonuclease of OLD family
LRDRSSRYIGDGELQSLETFARRMRGEIFFAERWMIVEGQADFLIVHALAEAMQYDLDEHGVSLIDAQNNGSPATFAVLARALGIPWIAVFDGDDAGRKYVQAIRARGFTDLELQNRCLLHSIGDLEEQLIADGLGPDLREILTGIGVQDVAEADDDVLSSRMREHKTAYAAALAAHIRGDARMVARAPEAFRTAVKRLPGLT